VRCVWRFPALTRAEAREALRQFPLLAREARDAHPEAGAARARAIPIEPARGRNARGAQAVACDRSNCRRTDSPGWGSILSIDNLAPTSLGNELNSQPATRADR
jgi:hypothetical protein